MAFSFRFVAELDYKQKASYGGKENKKGSVEFTFPGVLNFKAACGNIYDFNVEDVRELLKHYDAESLKQTPKKTPEELEAEKTKRDAVNARRRALRLQDESQMKEEIFANLTHKACGRCGKKDETTHDNHSCPYSEELRNDHSEKCNCCRKCTHECAMDI